MHRHRRAKILATVGPASAAPDMLKRLFVAGADTFRLNFSHGSHEDHARVFRAIRSLEEEVGRPIGILMDLQGPKIRLGVLDGGGRRVSTGERLQFSVHQQPSHPLIVPLPHPEIFAAVVPGDDLLIDDGKVRVRVVGVSDETLDTEVIVGGALSNRKGVNVPGAVLDISPLTTKDRLDLRFGLELGVDWVALSFVQKPGDLIEARGLIADRAGLVAKVEKPAALHHLDDIVRLSDAIMVARGDLGVEIPHEDVPGRQKELVRACRLAVKPVVVATQMLESMISSPTPTRAEASDVATAIYDGADAVMLSAESAAGDYPEEAVAMMDRVIRATESHKLYRSIIDAAPLGEEVTPPHAVASAAADLAMSIGASVIVAFTSSGTTAARVSRKRPATPILAVTPDKAVSRRLCLVWGVHSHHSENVWSYDEMVDRAVSLARSNEFAQPNDPVVVVAGIPFGQAGSTNNVRIAHAGAGESWSWTRRDAQCWARCPDKGPSAERVNRAR